MFKKISLMVSKITTREFQSFPGPQFENHCFRTFILESFVLVIDIFGHIRRRDVKEPMVSESLKGMGPHSTKSHLEQPHSCAPSKEIR